jgi:hypothetical protein
LPVTKIIFVQPSLSSSARLCLHKNTFENVTVTPLMEIPPFSTKKYPLLTSLHTGLLVSHSHFS